jgi:hypothetical protein
MWRKKCNAGTISVTDCIMSPNLLSSCMVIWKVRRQLQLIRGHSIWPCLGDIIFFPLPRFLFRVVRCVDENEKQNKNEKNTPRQLWSELFLVYSFFFEIIVISQRQAIISRKCVCGI